MSNGSLIEAMSNNLLLKHMWSTKKGVTEGSAQNCYIEIAIAMSLSPKGRVVEPSAKQPSCLIKQEDRNC